MRRIGRLLVWFLFVLLVIVPARLNAHALPLLERDAQSALTVGPFSVVSKQATPPSGDRMSQAPYFWPNPETQNHLSPSESVSGRISILARKEEKKQGQR
jgi:hypothetical protein